MCTILIVYYVQVQIIQWEYTKYRERLSIETGGEPENSLRGDKVWIEP
jgi:hypothetical protein